MKKNYLLIAISLICAALGVKAQVSSEPTPLLENSEGIVIYYYADQGNKGLINQPASDPIYAHTGVITSASSGDGDWKYAPSKWGDNAEKYKLEYVSDNVWKLNIGTIREYYGITNPDETVTKLAFVFRNANCSKEGKTASGGDIFIDVYPDGLHVTLSSNVIGNVLSGPTDLNLTASASRQADITISVNGTPLASENGVKSLAATYSIKDYGTYNFTATATADNESATAEVSYVYFAPAVQQDYPGGVPQMGPVKNDDGSVTFCIAAPQKGNICLLGSWNDFQMDGDSQMAYQNYNGVPYFWKTVKGLANDEMYMYYFLVDGEKSVGDPYARLVLDPSNDKYIPSSVYPNLPAYPSDKVSGVPLAIYQGNLNDYEWGDSSFKRPEQTDLVIYELLFRDFTGTEGEAKGNGTVNMAYEKLDYLKELGVNAIELLPINEFNGNNSWGYNPNFYFAPDKAYGTPDDYKHFINGCHRRGIAVILDMVFNQTDWQHPWYQMYEVGSNPFYNATAPHAYSVLNDWNQGYPLVQEQFKDVLKFWMEEYHVDGFRFDLVKGLGNNDSYANNGSSATDAYNASRVARMKELHNAMREVDPTAYFINENLAGSKEENEMAEDGEMNWANVNNQGCQFAMGYSSDSSLDRFYAPKDSRTWGSTVSYLESHDEERLAYKQNQYGASGVKGNVQVSMSRLGSAAAQMILCPGSHMIWMFSEMGNDETTKNSSGNDTSPKKVLWSYLDNEYRAALKDSYSELIEVRLANKDLFAESASFTNKCSAADWNDGRVMRSVAGDKELITVINPKISGQLIMSNIEFSFSSNDDYYIVSQSYEGNASYDVPTGRVMLPANSYVVIGSKAVTDVKGLEAAPQLGYYVENGQLVMGAGEKEVYSVNGTLMFKGKEATALTLSPGIYILRANGKTVKVLLR